MDETFAALRALIMSHAPGMVVTEDMPGKVQLCTTWKNPKKPKEWMWFGGVSLGKSYVSYHLMPVYTHSNLADAVSLELKKRMQGKSCFNFRSVEPRLFAALGELTAKCAAAYTTPFEIN